MEKTIDSFRAEYAFLSNFYPVEIIYNGIRYKTVEHAFQAAKSLDENEQKYVRVQDKPGAAKKAGKEITLRKDWDSIKYNIMYELVKCKFTQHKFLADKLIATGDAVLIEGNTWGDTIWGICRGKGTNWLGKILMKVRDEIK